MKSTEFLIELSPQTLASYKKKAGAQASELDKSAFDKDTPSDVAKKQIAKANKRFSGIVKATKKEFDKPKEVEEGQIYSGGNKEAGVHWYKPRHVPNQNELESVAEGLNEMDKSAPQPGRDGRVSHSTYGSRDKKGSDYFKGKEAPGKAITAKQASKDALDILKKQGVAEAELDEACWKGYHKEGNKKMFGKTYPNCVKNTNEEQLDEKCWDTHKQVGMKSKGGKMVPNCVPKESAIMKGLLK